MKDRALSMSSLPQIQLIKDAIIKQSDVVTLVEKTQVFNSHNGFFLVSDKNKIVIQIFPSNKLLNLETNNKKCKREGYLYIPIHIQTRNFRDVCSAINKHVSGLTSFVKKISQKLNDNLPESEVWFRNKILKEYPELYYKFEFKHNCPFKAFSYDLFSSRYNTVIEVDGSVHFGSYQIQKDKVKNKRTGEYGYLMIRIIHNNEDSFKSCIQQLQSQLTKLSSPSPKYNPRVIKRKYNK